jgi:hypothetical protein
VAYIHKDGNRVERIGAFPEIVSRSPSDRRTSSPAIEAALALVRIALPMGAYPALLIDTVVDVLCQDDGVVTEVVRVLVRDGDAISKQAAPSFEMAA